MVKNPLWKRSNRLGKALMAERRASDYSYEAVHSPFKVKELGTTKEILENRKKVASVRMRMSRRGLARLAGPCYGITPELRILLEARGMMVPADTRLENNDATISREWWVAPWLHVAIHRYINRKMGPSNYVTEMVMMAIDDPAMQSALVAERDLEMSSQL